MRLLRRTAGLAGLLAAACGSGEGPGEEPAGPAPSPQNTANTAGPADFHLLARREFPVGGKPTGLLAGDLDGDGHAELVALTRSPGGLHLWPGTESGIAPRARTLPVGDYPLGPFRLGASTIGFASQADAKLYVADARRLAADTLRSVDLPAVPRALAAGDLDADGAPELCVATVANELLVYRVGDSAPELVASHALPAELAGRPTAMHVLRDGSGLVLGSQITRELLHLSAGTVFGGGDSPPVALALAGIPRAAVEADVDRRDGDLELVVAGGDGSLWVFGWHAPGGAQAWLAPDGREPVAFGTLGTTPLDLAVADLDADGRDELVLINSYDSGYAVLGGLDPSLPGGAALRAREYAGQWPRACAVADLDGDGRPDLAVANRDSRRVSLLGGTGFAEPGRAPFAQAFRTPVGTNPTRVVAADLDGDELPELLAVDAGEQALVVRANEGGFVRARGPRFEAAPGPRALACGDFDGDGHADAALLLQQAEAARLTLFLGDGEGGLFRRDGPVVASEGSDLLAADLFGDAGDELVVADRKNGLLRVIAGSLDQPAVHEIPGAPGAAALAALDFDGEPAVAAAILADRRPGVAVFRPPATEPIARVAWKEGGGPLDTFPRDLVAADFDGDGRDDLALLTVGEILSAPGAIHVFLRRGDGFERSGEPLATGLAPAALAAGDLGADGRAELLCAAQNTHAVNLWSPRARDEGLLFEPLPDLGAGLGLLDVVLVDLDGDGRLDVVTANNFSSDLSAIYNIE